MNTTFELCFFMALNTVYYWWQVHYCPLHPKKSVKIKGLEYIISIWMQFILSVVRHKKNALEAQQNVRVIVISFVIVR